MAGEYVKITQPVTETARPFAVGEILRPGFEIKETFAARLLAENRAIPVKVTEIKPPKKEKDQDHHGQ